ncbi:MAG TPA: bifunctional phosphopantothenoylcysteine decarboxylase/phosphopantothenate--cysteine ligase CoaBC [Usitatibacteraceae bacterium]
MAKVLKTHQAVPTRAMPPRRIVLGITGGIAAYKAAELTRALKKAAIEVQVVVTEGAKAFITPTTLQALSGNRVYSDLWDASIPNNMAHIELSRGVDAILVAPATADFMAKLANGLCNDLLSTLCIARNADECALLLAPAMNREMWENPATQRNVTRLRADGVIILGPDEGDQACGETGMGRMLEPEALLADVESFYAVRSAPKSLAGKRALVTAGPTFEPIDPVRGITNASSGKMGYAIAVALRDAGADITLISGPTALADPAGMTTIRVQTAADMHAAVMSHIAQTDLFFAVAAVADYTPALPQAHKMKKSSDDLTLALQPTVDILATVAGLAPAPFCVGFAAESRDVLEYARKKRVAKGIPMIVANLATTAIGADDNEVTIVDASGDHPVPKGSKAEIAYAVVNHAAGLYLAVPASLQQQQKSKHA